MHQWRVRQQSCLGADIVRSPLGWEMRDASVTIGVNQLAIH